MIRINLLNSIGEKHAAPGRSGRNLVVAVSAVAVVALCAFLGMAGYRWFNGRRTVMKPEIQKPIKQELAPSTYSSVNVVEEVVKEVNDSRLKLRESGVLDLPYEQLSFAEKINYEYLFAKNTCELLARVIPPGIGLKSLEVENFQTVYAAGIGSSKELIQQMLVALKGEKVTVLSPPYSFIKPAGSEGFKFAFSCKADYGLNLTDPLVDGSLARLPSRGTLPEQLDKISKLAGQYRIKITKKPTHLSTDKVGNCYRSFYQLSGLSSYKDFAAFVQSVYNARIMAAFQRCSLTAKSASTIAIESQLVITTKE